MEAEGDEEAMKSPALVVAAVLVALGVAALVIPEVLIGIGRNMVSPAGLYAAATVRVGIGLVLMLAARESRAPGLLRAIGAVVLVVGVATPLFGVDAARARLDWEAAHVTLFRIEGAMFIWLGCVIVSTIRPLQKGGA